MSENMAEKDNKESNKFRFSSRIKLFLFVVLGIMFFTGLFFGYRYTSTPAHLRYPVFDHYHFRTQILVDGNTIDFSADEFQQEYDASSCSAELTGQPIDFHDGEDQMTHVHWGGITGGELLKYYGWNFIGGSDNSLGTRFDQGLLSMHAIPIFGDFLPEIAEDIKFFVFTGDETEFEKRDWQDFLDSGLEEFFGTESLLNTTGEQVGFNILDIFSGTVSAHGEVVDEHSEIQSGESEEERLTRINNLIGNVVIFAQDSEPTDKEVTARFNDLVPLHDSVCGG